eukprot:1592290-Rhodomonas_salina.1
MPAALGTARVLAGGRRNAWNRAFAAQSERRFRRCQWRTHVLVLRYLAFSSPLICATGPHAALSVQVPGDLKRKEGREVRGTKRESVRLRWFSGKERGRELRGPRARARRSCACVRAAFSVSSTRADRQRHHTQTQRLFPESLAHLGVLLAELHHHVLHKRLALTPRCQYPHTLRDTPRTWLTDLVCRRLVLHLPLHNIGILPCGGRRRALSQYR